MYWIIVMSHKEAARTLHGTIRPAHRAYIWRTDLPARLLLGSPLISDDGTRPIGSWLLVEAPDRASVEAFAASDPYVLADLPDRITITALHADFDASRILPR